MSSLYKVPNDFDIVYIGCGTGCNPKNKLDGIDNIVLKFFLGNKVKKFKKINENVYTPAIPLALHAYIVSAKGAAKLVKKIKNNISTHVDMQMLIQGDDLKVYAVEPKLGYQKVSTETSNISVAYPRLINGIFSNYKDENNIPFDYKISVPLGQILSVPISGITISLFLFSLILGFLHIDLHIFNTYFILYNLTEIILSPNLETMEMIMKFYILMFVGIKITSLSNLIK
jgi:hypothetical protein